MTDEAIHVTNLYKNNLRILSIDYQVWSKSELLKIILTYFNYKYNKVGFNQHT